jgi:hypothetical protein
MPSPGMLPIYLSTANASDRDMPYIMRVMRSIMVIMHIMESVPQTLKMNADNESLSREY